MGKANGRHPGTVARSAPLPADRPKPAIEVSRPQSEGYEFEISVLGVKLAARGGLGIAAAVLVTAMVLFYAWAKV